MAQLQWHELRFEDGSRFSIAQLDDGSAYRVDPIWMLFTVDADESQGEQVNADEIQFQEHKKFVTKKLKRQIDWCEDRCEHCDDVKIEGRCWKTRDATGNGKLLYIMRPFYLIWLDGPNGGVSDEPIGDCADINEAKNIACKHANKTRAIHLMGSAHTNTHH